MNKILIYDDNADDAQILNDIISKIDDWCSCRIEMAQNKNSAESLLSNETCILLQDIEISDNENGIDFAVMAKKKFPLLKVIFVTAHNKYCSDIFAAKPCGFIQKPITFEKVKRTLNFIDKRSLRHDSITIHNSKYSSIKLRFDEISYIESYMKQIIFYNIDFEEIIRTREKISVFTDQLPDSFVRCHQSFIVNLDHVTSMERSKFIIEKRTEIPISQKYSSEAKNAFIKNISSFEDN